MPIHKKGSHLWYDNKLIIGLPSAHADRIKHDNSFFIYLGVGPFGVVVPLGVLGPAVLALLRTLGVEGVRGVIRGWAVEELVGVRGATRGWGVEGALVLADVGV